MLPLDQFFFSIIPFFQNNPTSLLNYFFESKPFIPKTEFLNKCSSLNIFPKEQILYTYSKLDITFSGRVERSQIESILVMQPVQIQRQSFSGPGPTGLQISQIQTQNPTYQSSGGPNNKFGSQIPFGNQNQVSGFENSQNSNYGYFFKI